MFMFGAPFEGKDNEYSDCSQSFPFFGMQGKTEDSEPVINSTATQMTLYGLNDNQETVSPSVTTMTPSTVTENSLIMAENREDNMSEKNNPTLDKDSLYIHRCQNGASGVQCNFDDFIGIDQGSIEGTGQGEDRFCGARLLEHDFIICKYINSNFCLSFLNKTKKYQFSLCSSFKTISITSTIKWRSF